MTFKNAAILHLCKVDFAFSSIFNNLQTCFFTHNWVKIGVQIRLNPQTEPLTLSRGQMNESGPSWTNLDEPKQAQTNPDKPDRMPVSIRQYSPLCRTSK